MKIKVVSEGDISGGGQTWFKENKNMDRAIREPSKLLAKKWAAQNRQIHLRKIHDARPCLDTLNEPRHHHLYQRGKRDQIL